MAASKPPPSADDSLVWIGHGVPAALGVLALGAAVAAWRADLQITLVVTLAVVGVLLPVLAYHSLHRSRPAWSFLIALCVVLGIMTLFGAPKVRNLVGIHFGVALMLPFALGAATFCLSMLGDRYKG